MTKNIVLSRINIAITSLKNYFTLLLAVGAGLFWLVFINYTGLMLNPDSSRYMGFALGMHFGGNYFVMPLRPPMYPFIIHMFMFFKRFPAEAAALASGIIMILTLVVFVLIMQKFSRDIFLNSILLLSLFTFSKFVFVFGSAWTEGLYGLFTLLALYFVLRHHETQRTTYYIFAAICVSSTALTRYLGYSLVVTFFLYTLYFLWVGRKDKKERTGWLLKYAVLFSISYLPSLLYIIRNYFISQTFHGARIPTTLTLIDNLNRVSHLFGKELSVYFLILLAVSFLLYVILLKHHRDSNRRPLLLVSTFILVYISIYMAMILHTTSTIKIDPVSTRYFSPVYPLFFLFICFAFCSIPIVFPGPAPEQKKINAHSSKKLVKIIFYSLLLATLYVHARSFPKFLKDLYKPKTLAKCSVLISGYNLNPIANQFSNYFADALKTDDVIYVSAIYETANGLNYPHLGGLPFFREKTLSHPAFTHISFKDVYPIAHKSPSKGFTITLTMANREKSLVFLNLPTKKADKSLLIQLRALMVASKIKVLHLVVNNDLPNLKIASHLPAFLPAQLIIQAKQEMGAYWVYRIAYQSNR